jgi:hypothetical protein
MIGRVLWVAAAVAGVAAVVMGLLSRPALLPAQCLDVTLLYTGDTNGWIEACSG